MCGKAWTWVRQGQFIKISLELECPFSGSGKVMISIFDFYFLLLAGFEARTILWNWAVLCFALNFFELLFIAFYNSVDSLLH